MTRWSGDRKPTHDDAATVYLPDRNFWSEPWLRGHGNHCVPAIDADIAGMERSRLIPMPTAGTPIDGAASRRQCRQPAPTGHSRFNIILHYSRRTHLASWRT
jgi:hypothetical protein